MNCFQCCYKHLSAALSYGKQIIGGYDGNSELNHQIDFLGELVNAEHHLELIRTDIYNELHSLRKQITSNDFVIKEETLDVIRIIFNKVRKFQKKIDSNKSVVAVQPTIQSYNQQHYNIVFENITNLYHFELCIKTLKTKALNNIDVIVLNSSIELPKDVKVLNKKLYDYVNDDQDEQYFVLMKENQVLLKPFDFNYLRNTYVQKQAEDLSLIKDGNFLYSFQANKPQMINRKKYLQVMKNVDAEYTLTTYFNLIKEQPKYNDFFYSVFVDREICCNIKTRLKTLPFGSYNSKGYTIIDEFIKVN